MKGYPLEILYRVQLLRQPIPFIFECEEASAISEGEVMTEEGAKDEVKVFRRHDDEDQEQPSLAEDKKDVALEDDIEAKHINLGKSI